MSERPALVSQFASQMKDLFSGSPPATLVVAFSGGGDSTALLDLTCTWARQTGSTLHAVIVDHGLRDGSAAEAEEAATVATSIGATPTVLTWRGWQGQGNLQDAARTARRDLLSDFAQANGASAVLLGHTLDDQAETFLMRLARGSGVEGLSGMARDIDVSGTRFLRPLLSIRRSDLRKHLKARRLAWAEDPSNDDDRFDRVRMRKLMPLLAENGLTPERLSATSDALRGAAEVVSLRARQAAEDCVTLEFGDVLIDRAGLEALEDDTRHRIFAQSLCWVSGNPLRPRRSALKSVLAEVLDGRRATLHGCLIFRQGAAFRTTREYAAVATLDCQATETWDGRWQVSGADTTDTIRALGNHGIELIEKNGRTATRDTLLSMPSIWRHGQLVAVPLIGWGAAMTMTRNPENSAFFSTLFSR